jgi:hypothetical protein
MFTNIRDVSHLILINPLVENLFTIDDSIWKNFWYESLLPKWQNYAFGSVFGLNRLLMMAKIIEPQLNSNVLNETILNRQVLVLFCFL